MSIRGPARIGVALVAAVIGATLGGFLGAQWYVRFGPPWAQLGYEFEGIAEIFRGAVAGAIAVGATAYLWLRDGAVGWRRAAAVVLGCVAAAVLFVVGLTYVGALTDQGRADPIVYLAVSGLPLSVLLLLAVARFHRRATR